MSADVVDPSGVLRFLPGSLGYVDMLERVGAALQAGVEVWFPLAAEDARPFFALKPMGGSIQVLGRDGDHIGTFAAVEPAISRGWERGCGI